MAKRVGVKKERKFSDIFSKYKTYDTSQGHGSQEEWSVAWESMTGGQAAEVLSEQSRSPLAILGFLITPTVSELKTRYRELILKHHPDQGGDSKMAREIIAAYTVVLESIS